MIARYRATWLALIVVGASVSCPFLGAQEADSGESASPAAASSESAESSKSSSAPATTTGDPKVPVDHLELRLRPLTKEELVVEADAWLDFVKAKQVEISEAKVAVKKGESGDGGAGAVSAEMVQKVTALEAERTSLIDRLHVVLASLKKKGGEVEPYKLYTAAVGGLDIDVTDAGAAWTTVREWLRSDEGGIRWAKNIAAFCATLFGFWVLSLILGRVARKLLSRAKGLTTLLRNFIVRMIRRTVLVIGVIVALASLEVDIGPLLAIIGGAAFVIGFALQGTLSNFASGLLILFYRPFDVGDFVEAGGVSGSVAAMNLVSTRINTPDNKMLFVPNNTIWNGIITNVTGSPTRRVDLVFGIGYGDDIAKAQDVLEKVVADNELVLSDPAPTIRVNELADSSVNFIVRPWVKTEDYWTVQSEITRRVKESFDEAGISIPFPQQDVHMHEVSVS